MVYRGMMKNEIVDLLKNEEDIGSSDEESEPNSSRWDDARKMFSSRSIKDHALNSFRKFQEMNN